MLSSAKLFFGLSMILSIQFYCAAILCKKGFDGSGFMTLNDHHLVDWIVNFHSEHSLVAAWLFITGILLFVMALNVCARVFIEFNVLLKFRKSAANSNNGRARPIFFRKAFVFLIHFSFILMIFFYFISSVTGIKFLGPVIEKGKLLKHPLLPVQMECLEIVKSKTRKEKPMVVFKPADSDKKVQFQIPGWYEGIYYDVRNTIASPDISAPVDEKPNRGLQLRLFAHRFNVKFYSTVLILWFSGFFCFMMARRLIFWKSDWE